MRILTAAIMAFLLGLTAGAFFFGRTLPRSFLAIDSCGTDCLTESELAGLLVSAGIQHLPRVVPVVEMESDTCVAVKHPRPSSRYHYVLFPKRDVKNIASLTDDDQRFVMGCFALVRQLVEREHLRNYRLMTNGPGLQEVAYLHFHLMARSAGN